jgi:hypothetical protein
VNIYSWIVPINNRLIVQVYSGFFLLLCRIFFNYCPNILQSSSIRLCTRVHCYFTDPQWQTDKVRDMHIKRIPDKQRTSGNYLSAHSARNRLTDGLHSVVLYPKHYITAATNENRLCGTRYHGQREAANLLMTGYQVIVWNRSAEKMRSGRSWRFGGEVTRCGGRTNG